MFESSSLREHVSPPLCRPPTPPPTIHSHLRAVCDNHLVVSAPPSTSPSAIDTLPSCSSSVHSHPPPSCSASPLSWRPTFLASGLVQEQGSHNGSVVVKNVSLAAAGRYRCEVSADNSFQTVGATKTMHVAAGKQQHNALQCSFLVDALLSLMRRLDTSMRCYKNAFAAQDLSLRGETHFCAARRRRRRSPLEQLMGHCLITLGRESHSRKLFPFPSNLLLGILLGMRG